jgi:hypothetical protein
MTPGRVSAIAYRPRLGYRGVMSDIKAAAVNRTHTKITARKMKCMSFMRTR